MSRTVVGFINSGYLNSAASASPTGSVDVETGLPIATGINVGAFQEFSDAEAKLYSSPSGRQLYSGIYQWVQLDPSYGSSSAIPVGTPLFFKAGATGIVVTPTNSGTTNFPDWAGTSIDPNFSLALPYAFIQVGPGNHGCLMSGTCTIGTDVVTLTATDVAYQSTVTASATAVNYVGYPLATITGAVVGQVRIISPLKRY